MNENKFNEIWNLIDYLLDCCEYPYPGEIHILPKIEDEDIRIYAKKELEKIYEK